MLKTLFAPRKPVQEVVLDDQPIPVDGFVDIYLRARNYSINPDNRKMVAEKISRYRGHPSVDRDSLEAYLDKGWNI
ncbi:MAG: hypothetical protein ABIP44_11830 [Pseudoxanthomonas sp.]